MGKITEDIKKEIIELYKTGIGSIIIVKKYNICNRSVLNILNKIPNLVRPIKIITDEIKKNIIENYLLNVGVVIMSKEFNLSRKTISNILKKAGLLKNRYHSEEFYPQFWEEDGKWWGYWHCNPSIYNETYFNKKIKKYPKDIWEHNKNKNIIIELIKNKYESK